MPSRVDLVDDFLRLSLPVRPSRSDEPPPFRGCKTTCSLGPKRTAEETLRDVARRLAKTKDPVALKALDHIQKHLA